MALLVIGVGVEIVFLVLDARVTSVPEPIAIAGYVAGGAFIVAGLLALLARPKGQVSLMLTVASTAENDQGGYGRSINGKLESAWVPVKVAAENRGTTDVRIGELRCELYRKRFLRNPKLVETLHYFDADQLDWLLTAQGLRVSRSVTFSRRDDYPWLSTKVKIGETLGVRMKAVVNTEKSPIVIELPNIPVKGPYSAASS